MSIVSAVQRFGLGAACLALLAVPGLAQTISPGTALPVEFPRSIMAGKAHPGDSVLAKTTQVVFLTGGRILPAGAIVSGHVVASAAFAFNPAPWAAQRPSILSIHFDDVKAFGTLMPVNLTLRAVAGPVASEEARMPHGLDEIDWSPVQTLIGGDTTSALQKTLLSPGGEVVGYRRKPGLFAHLIASSDTMPGFQVRCDAGTTEQSVGTFSPNACGVYGIDGVSLSASGDRGDGSFVLQSRHRSVVLPAGSTALLEETLR